jgi:hypothetical protein
VDEIMTSPIEEPSPEQLAAFLDGEYEHLGGMTPERIEEWLKSNPGACAQAQVQRRLAQLWQRTSPDEPSPSAWRGVLKGIERGLDKPQRPHRGPWRWWGVTVGLFVGAAASAALVVALAKRPAVEPFAGPRPGPSLVETGLPVVGEDEVEILSVRGDDVPSFVLGVLPMHGLLVLAGPGEVSLIRSNPPAEDRTMPEVRMNEEETPMVWAPPAPETKPIQPTP